MWQDTEIIGHSLPSSTLSSFYRGTEENKDLALLSLQFSTKYRIPQPRSGINNINCSVLFVVRILSMNMKSKEMSKSMTNNRNMVIKLADTAHIILNSKNFRR